MKSERLHIEQLTEAVEHRTTIGMALGMLMERFDFDHDQAFDYLRQCSQAQNRKLYDICAEFTASRQLPQMSPTSQTA
jgi:AmiR/NasT family two-component response regulator